MKLIKIPPILCLTWLIATVTLAGCTTHAQVSNNSTSPGVNPTPSVAPVITATFKPRQTNTPQTQLPEETPTFVVTSNTSLPPTVQPTDTVVPSATPTIPTVEMSEPLFVCTEPASKFNARETLGIFLLSHLRFVDEQTITFEGWARRPEPTNQNSMVSSVLARPFASQIPSARYLFKAGTVDLESGEVLSRTLDFLPSFSSPCSGDCPQEVIGQSPDEGWQLIQVSDWRETEVGIWLVENSGFTTRLVDYVPSFSTWQWAEDGSMLWFDHSVYDYGGKALVVNLESTPITQTVISEADDRFDPTYYSLAFSPLDKTVLSTQLEPAFTNSEELYKLGFEPEMAIISTSIVSDIQNVSWNEATQQYLLTIIKNNELYISDESGTVLLKVPASTLEIMYPVLREGNISLKELYASVGYALSPTGQHLALFTNSGGEMWVFNCQENNNT